MNKPMTFLVLLTAAFTWMACDWERLDKCEWYLVPEEKHAHLVHPGHVAVCLRNYTTKKQKCFLEMGLDEAQAAYGKKLRYSSVKLDKSVMPRKILKYSLCQE
ncbi:MAG: hypothetical protein H6618_10330 [Deltaproteobacteria bacterium]|nr:hypothetical protein [Deltaproteobacteria bacterium]